ncbi:hypothetical protein BDR07DRAFT_1406370 [Suillus spraguei]|nr:hypothetical protein BDR07DRAFT_1406370 [Suillus spraguei]
MKMTELVPILQSELNGGAYDHAMHLKFVKSYSVVQWAALGRLLCGYSAVPEMNILCNHYWHIVVNSKHQT